MNTFKKFNKIYRIEMPTYPIKGKYFLAKKNEKLLLRGNCTVTEKIDGGNTGIYKSKGKMYIQKKGSNIDDSHPQFRFFKNEWFWKNKHKLELMPDNIVIYGELMRCVHTVKYNKLPDWWLVFDIYDLKQQEYISWNMVEHFCKKAGLHTVPLIYQGPIKSKTELDRLMPTQSAFGETAEGIVVKNYRQQVMGKYVYPWFVKQVDSGEHWDKRKIELNEVI